MKTSQRHILFLALLTTSMPWLGAQTFVPYPGEYMSLGAGARGIAMGGAYSALSSDATGSYWNPAALADLAGVDALLMHEERYAGLLNYDLAAGAMPYDDNSALGITLLRLGADGIKDSRNALVDQNGNGELDAGEWLDYSKITYFTAADWALFVSYAHRASDELSWGVSVKVIRRSLAEFTANGLGFDAGLTYRPVNSLILSAVIQDVTTTLVAWSTGRTELISPAIRVGGAYAVDVGSFRIIPAAEGVIRFENRGRSAFASLGPVSLDPYAGIEVSLDNVLSLRGGVNEVGHAAVGAGLHIKRLYVDYAYAGFGETSQLGTSHRISLRLRLDRSP